MILSSLCSFIFYYYVSVRQFEWQRYTLNNRKINPDISITTYILHLWLLIEAAVFRYLIVRNFQKFCATFKPEHNLNTLFKTYIFPFVGWTPYEFSFVVCKVESAIAPDKRNFLLHSINGRKQKSSQKALKPKPFDGCVCIFSCCRLFCAISVCRVNTPFLVSLRLFVPTF